MQAHLTVFCCLLIIALAGCDSSKKNPASGPQGTAVRAHQSVVQQYIQYFPAQGQIATPYCFGPAGCPIMIGGEDVWSFQTAAPTGAKLARDFLVYPHERRALLHSLSIDGKYVAQLHAGNARPDPGDAKVFDVATGKVLLEIPNCNGRFISVTSNGCVHVLGDNGTSLVTWNLQSKQEISRLRLPYELYMDRELAVRSDGMYCVCGNNQELEAFVYELASGTKVLTLPIPQAEMVSRGVKSFYSPREFTFSFEGDEIFAEMDTHVIGWDLQAKNTFLVVNSGDTGSVVSLPGKTGVIVGDTFVDRANSRPLIEFRTSHPPRAVDHNRLLVERNASRPIIFTIPWEKINASLAAMKDPASTAIIAPGKSIAIQVTADGGSGEVVQRVTDSLQAKAAAAGLTVDPNSPTKIEVKITEDKLEDVLLVEVDPFNPGSGPGGVRGTETGRTNQFESMVAYADMKLVGPSGQIVWQQKFFSRSDQGYSITSNKDEARRQAYQALAGRMQGFNFPYFVPASSDLIALPLTVQ